MNPTPPKKPPTLPRPAVTGDGHDATRSLAMLAPKLDAIGEGDVVRPSTDPSGGAATALLIADYLGQHELRARLASADSSSADVDQLRHLARAIAHVTKELGGDYLSDGVGVPGDLVQRGEALRASVAAALEKALPEDRELIVWLEAIRLGTGVVDLVYDLRTLAELCARHRATEAVASVTTSSIPQALSAADAIEFALRKADSPETAQQRTTLARLWTLFVPAYERAAAAAAKLSRDVGKEQQFPELAVVASHRRARRRPVSLVPPHVLEARKSLAPRRSGRPSKSASTRPSTPPLSPEAARAVLANIPAAANLPDFGDVELIEASDVALAPAGSADGARSEAPHPATAEEREHWSDTRGANRHTVEIEVGISSESNFYLGFTENLSAGGVFVATYLAKPLGAEVVVALELPTGESLRIPGVVRWHRDGTSEGWPGMGVQFEGLSAEDEATIRKFLSLREPMFYDD
ncbi:MAG: hypothetical protein JWP97_472 [Labilithrix sp.]|nr:hypothetical protein [Labilithrix sp.]